MNRKFGRLLATLFVLSMFFEVACLPLFTSFAFQFEKSIFTELADKEKEDDKTESLGDFKVAVHHSGEHFPNPVFLSNRAHEDDALDPNAGISDHVFIKNHSLRL